MYTVDFQKILKQKCAELLELCKKEGFNALVDIRVGTYGHKYCIEYKEEEEIK